MPVAPAGPSAGSGRRFVVQRHRARRLHYDFRLEVDGVLASWAVPRGPTLDASARRMAVQVEDHPLEYFSFEGVIPEGQYGAGDVIVWDWGTYEPEVMDDPAAALRAGELKFRLAGEKLAGRFTLVRTGRRGRSPTASGEIGDRNWLLIKKRDERAVPGWDPEAHPRSVKSARTNEEVAAGAAPRAVATGPSRATERVAPATPGTAPRVPAAASGHRRPEAHAPTAPATAGARREPMPDFVPPMLATPVERAFSDPDWLYEVKWDGYRVQAVVRDGSVRLWTRNRRDAATYFPALADPPVWLDAREAIVDGEVVALRSDGTADFGRLQGLTGLRQGTAGHAAGGRGRSVADEWSEPTTLAYEVFDLLYLDGHSLLDVPLEERKRLLRTAIRPHPIVRYAGHIAVEGEAFFDACAARGVEGMVAKLRTSRYQPGRRSPAWRKVKVRPEQEVVVGGYVPGAGQAADLAALAVGVYAGDEFRYAGRVGSGFDEGTRRALLARLTALLRPEPAFANPPVLVRARWVEPRLVVRVEFAGWTADGMLRQAVYRGLEPDRDPRSVRRETPSNAAPRPHTAAAASAGPAPSAGAAGPSRSGAPWSAPVEVRPGTAGAAGLVTADELAELDRLPASGGRWHVAGREVRLTNLDRLLFPAGNLTKRDLIRYYASVAQTLLPYFAGRACTLTRWPDGVEGPHFWQQALPAGAPAWISRRRLAVHDDRGARTYLVADAPATLAWLANQAAIELHPWTSLADAPDEPTYALIDIDPGERTSWEEVALIARLYRDALAHLRVRGYPKTTGKRGIQVWIPVRPGYTFDDTRAWVETLSRAIGAVVPELVSWEWEKASRRGLARLDYTQNARRKTLVGPYVVRAQPTASVSTPITWEELDDPALRADRWTVRTIGERLADRGDCFRGVLDRDQELPSL